MNFPEQTIRDLCLKYGEQVHLPASIDGVKLMYAIACNESSCGKNCTPRHEPAYDVGGRFSTAPAQAKLLKQFGPAAAASYGPWQVMFCNCGNTTPDELLKDADRCAQAYVAFMNSWVIGFRKAATIQQIAETYNSGTFGANMSAGVLKYAADAEQHYLNAPVCRSTVKAA